MADSQRLVALASPPSSPVKGTIYLDDSLGLGWYDGSGWVYTTGGGGGGGGTVDTITAADTSVVVDSTDPANPTVRTNTLDVIATDQPPAAAWSNNSKKITSVADPASAQDAATKHYVDAETTRAESAEALLAPLASAALTGNPTAPTQTAGNNSTRLATTAYVDTGLGLKLSLAGGTMTGAIAMGAHKITGLANGSASSDAAAFGQIPTDVDAITIFGDAFSVNGTPANGQWLLRSGGVWRNGALSLDAIASEAPTGGDISMGGHKLTTLANGTASSDAAALGQVLAVPGTPSQPTRAFGTAYQPSATRPVWLTVNLYLQSNGSSQLSEAHLVIGPTSSPATIIGYWYLLSVGSQIDTIDTISVLVPAGWYYKIVQDAVGANQIIEEVTEQPL